MSCSSIRIEIVDIKTLQGLASGEDRRDHGVVCRGDHHQPVQRSGREEALEGSRSHTRHGTGGGVAVTHESRVKRSLLALAFGKLHMLVNPLHLAGPWPTSSFQSSYWYNNKQQVIQQ